MEMCIRDRIVAVLGRSAVEAYCFGIASEKIGGSFSGCILDLPCLIAGREVPVFIGAVSYTHLPSTSSPACPGDGFVKKLIT